MAAQKRTVPAGKVEHRLGNITVEIVFDRTDKVFRATYAGESYENKVIDEVSKVVYQAIEASLSMEWTPIITVKPMKPEFGTAQREDYIGFHFDCLWIAQFPDGAYRSCQWNGKETGNMLLWARQFYWDNERHGPFIVPTMARSYNEVTYYLPYSEELWAKLDYIREKIKELRTMLMGLFESDEGVQFLLSSDWQLSLPAPVAKKQEVS